MAEYLSPAVYIEEIPSGIKPIEGVGTSTGAFVGHAEKGPIGEAIPINNFSEFLKTFGSYTDDYLAFAVKAFFDEGGKSCYVVRTCHFEIPSGQTKKKPTALASSQSFNGTGDFSNGLTTGSKVEKANGFARISFDGAQGDAPFLITYDSATKDLTLTKGDGTTDTATLSNSAIQQGETEEVTFDTFGATVVLNHAFDKNTAITVTDNTVSITAGTAAIDASSIKIISSSGDISGISLTTLTLGTLSTPDSVTITTAGGFNGSFDGSLTGTKTVSLSDAQGNALQIEFNLTTEFDGNETAGSITLNELENLVVSMGPRSLLSTHAISPGLWGDDIGILIQQLEGELFKLHVKYRGTDIETYDNLTMDKTKDTYVETVINRDSVYITAKDETPLTSTLSVSQRRPKPTTSPTGDFSNGLTTGSKVEKANGFARISFDGAQGDAPFLITYDSATKDLTLTKGDGTTDTATLSNSAIQQGETEEVTFDTFGATVVLNHAFDKNTAITVTDNTVSITAGTAAIDASSIKIISSSGDISGISLTTLTLGTLSTPDSVTITTAGGFNGSFDGSLTGTKTVSLSDAQGNALQIEFNLTTEFDGNETAGSITLNELENLVVSMGPRSLLLTNGSDGLSNMSADDYIGDGGLGNGLYAFDKIDGINIVAVPDAIDRDVHIGGMTYCENRGDCFYVGDSQMAISTADQVLNYKFAQGDYSGGNAINSKYGALYTPWIYVFDPRTGGRILIPSSGAVAGRYANTDGTRGVHKAPAGIEDGRLRSGLDVEKDFTDADQEKLNPKGINVIRKITGVGNVIWGARTVSSDPEWRYINVRRLFLFLEESIEGSTKWVVFEPNDPSLWKSIVRNIRAFLRIQWLEGKLVGNTEEEAFYVKCDEETNPQESIDIGRVITEIGVAPSKPAEFVIFRIAQWDGGASVSE